ncbi:DEAD/DEAH box helicase, partial [Aliarcobacter butzleri]|nr:DEAD/DEAH box helicase [Aliarcobacter butzleri]
MALKKRDIIAAAQSGTGKTAAFLLPILEELIEQKQTNELPILRTLILVPTRELATQIGKVIDDYAKYLDIKRLAIFGGVSSKEQEKKLSNGIDILVST